jgi:hypothetical protein
MYRKTYTKNQFKNFNFKSSILYLVYIYIYRCIFIQLESLSMQMHDILQKITF